MTFHHERVRSALFRVLYPTILDECEDTDEGLRHPDPSIQGAVKLLIEATGLSMVDTVYEPHENMEGDGI